MSRVQIEAFLFDEENEQKIAVHGLSISRIAQILDNRFLIVRNKRRRRGLYLLIGRDWGGAYISVPIEATNDPVVWRPITAWPSKKGEQTLYEQGWRHHDKTNQG